MRKVCLVLFMCFVCVSSLSAYSGNRNLTDTFDGPDMTNWDNLDDNYPGEYNGAGQFILADGEGILRYIDEGSYTAVLDVIDIDLATGDPGAGNAGYFNLLLLDTSYRLHVSIVNSNDGSGDQMAILGDKGNGYELWSNNPLGNLTSMTLKYSWDFEANRISVWAAINGGPMTQYADEYSHELGNGVMLEQIYAPEHYASGGNEPNSPIFSLDNYVIVGPEVQILEGDGVEVDEEDPTSDTYDIVLATEPNGLVTVTVDPDEQIEVNGAGGGVPIELYFSADPNASNGWIVPQTVTVTAIDDSIQEGTPHYGLISHTVSCDLDSEYDGSPVNDVVVTIIDNERWCGEPGTVYYPADINEDCYVNLDDLAILAADWLGCTDPFDPVNCVLELP